MYAVIESGGKQYRVELGTELAVDRLDAQPGATIRFEQVMLVAGEGEPAVGRPHVAGATVSADVVRQERGEKIVVFKYRPKARHRSKNGARAELTILRISDIVHDGQSAAKQAEAARTERERIEAAEAEAAAKQAEADKALARKLASTAKAEEAARSAAAGEGASGRRRAVAAKPADQGGKPATSGPKTKAAAKAEPKTPSRATAKSGGPAKPAAKASPKGKSGASPAQAEAKRPRGASGRTHAPQPPRPGRAGPKKDQ